jgi:hypothetical protein
MEGDVCNWQILIIGDVTSRGKHGLTTPVGGKLHEPCSGQPFRDFIPMKRRLNLLVRLKFHSANDRLTIFEKQHNAPIYGLGY